MAFIGMVSQFIPAIRLGSVGVPVRIGLNSLIRKPSSSFSTFEDQIDRRKVITKGEESENVMRMWFEWMAKHKNTFNAKKEKRMVDSYFTQEFPFSKDRILREEYINFWGDIRLAKLLENLDALAGRIAYEHCYSPDFSENPLTIVTASVDKILLLKPLPITRDFRMSGHVSWVGSSSMEVSLAIESRIPEGNDQPPPVKADEKWEQVLITNFVMVARDTNKGGKAIVNKLHLVTDEEKAIFRRGEELHKKRREASTNSLLKTPPTREEIKVIHDLLMEPAPSNALHTEETKVEWTKICHPQERNIHNKIFGGYLMREAFDLAYANAMIYSKTRPLFINQDSIQFRKPVEIGSVLNLTSKVVRSRGFPHHSFQIAVDAKVIDPATGERDTTNVFQFTFYSKGDLLPVRPQTYLEAINFLDASRRQEESLAFDHRNLQTRWIIDPKDYS